MTKPSANTPAVWAIVTVPPRETRRAASPCPDEVCGDHRLPVARRERVSRAPEGGDQRARRGAARPSDSSPRSISFSKPPPTSGAASTAADRAAPGARTRSDSTVAAADETSSGDSQEIRRVRTQRVARRSSTGRRRSSDPPAVACTIVTSRQPIRPGKLTIVERELTAVAGRAVHDLEPQRLQTAPGAARETSVCDHASAPAASVKDELVGEVRNRRDSPALRAPRADLVRRDLGDVERVADVDVAPGDSIPA